MITITFFVFYHSFVLRLPKSKMFARSCRSLGLIARNGIRTHATEFPNVGQQIIQPSTGKIRSINDLRAYLRDPENCVFGAKQNMTFNQKMICGGLGIGAAVAGISTGLATIWASSDVFLDTLKELSKKYKEAKLQQATGQAEIVYIDLNKFDSKLDAIGESIHQFMLKLGDSIFTGVETTMDAVSTVVPESVFFGTAITAGACGSAAYLPIALQMTKEVFVDISRYFKEIIGMKNCCNIIRHTAKGSLMILFGTTISTVALGFSVLPGYISYYMLETVNERWIIDEFMVELDPVHDKGYKLGPILD